MENKGSKVSDGSSPQPWWLNLGAGDGGLGLAVPPLGDLVVGTRPGRLRPPRPSLVWGQRVAKGLESRPGFGCGLFPNPGKPLGSLGRLHVHKRPY